MKIKLESNKIIKAVKELAGIEVVLENSKDAKEAIDLILSKTEFFQSEDYKKLKDIDVTSIQEYKTSAVDYNLVFMLEFIFEDGISTDTKVVLIKGLQSFFERL